ncbi:MAG TPA: hypothetical protein VF114_09430, partial [Candidatus Limnocylindria bacterium]
PRGEVRKAVEQRFSQARMARDYVDLYHRLIAAAQPELRAPLAIDPSLSRPVNQPPAMADLAPMNGGNAHDEAPTNG